MIVVSSPLCYFPGKGEVQRYEAKEISFPDSMVGNTSYVGHPNTQTLVEALGATTVSGRWEGPEVGESFVAVPLANNQREGGYTKDTAVEDVKQLRAILITRLA